MNRRGFLNALASLPLVTLPFGRSHEVFQGPLRTGMSEPAVPQNIRHQYTKDLAYWLGAKLDELAIEAMLHAAPEPARINFIKHTDSADNNKNENTLSGL